MPSHKGERIFISYSHQDKKYLEDLKKILTPKMRDGTISLWDDTTIQPGYKWREEIDKALSSATIALLLVSKDYFASDFIAKEEFLPILDKVKRGGLRVFWLLLNPCSWRDTKIEEYQALHETDKPLSKLAPDKRQEKLVEICKRIVEEMKEPPSIIKGWYPYTYQDKDIFARLQRHDFVEACVSGICHEAFRFGLLQGESGVGKTSLLQAGLWPRLEAEGYDCIYIDFTNDPPLNSIRRSFRDRNFLSETEMRDCSFSSLLQKHAQQRSKPLILLLDHFEKVPIQPNQQPKDDFFKALVSWHSDISIPLIKILASVETNFVGEMSRLFNDINFTFHPQQCFLLSKLSRDEASKIVRIMAEREGLLYEAGFVDRLSEKSGSKAKEEVSPVVLQITAHTIRFSSKSDEERAFTTRAIEKKGGIEGIYECVLEGELQKLDPENRHIAEQILKALIDWNKGTRAGVLTREELKIKMDVGQTARKIQDHRRPIEMRDLPAQKLDDILTWLRSCRFIRQSQHQGVATYELYQDWLTRVVINRMAEDIEPARKANRLLSRRCKAWKDNDQSPRLLLSRKELRQVKEHSSYVDWDIDRDEKRDFVTQSEKLSRLKMAGITTIAVGSVLALVLLVVVWNEKTVIPLKYVKKELFDVSQYIENPETLSKIAKALFFDQQFEKVKLVIGRMTEEWDRDVARSEISTLALCNNLSFLMEANGLADDIRDEREKSDTKEMLEKIAGEKDKACEYPTNGRHSTQPGELLKAAHEYVTKEIGPAKKLDIMAALVQAAAQSAETSNSSLPKEKVQVVLKDMREQYELLRNMQNRHDAHFRTFQGIRSAAEIAAYLGVTNEPLNILREAERVAGDISIVHEQTLAMRSITIAAAQFALRLAHDCRMPTCDLNQVEDLLKLAEETKNRITEDSGKYAALRAIVEAKARLASIHAKSKYLDEARNMAKEIHSKAHLSSALRVLVAEMVKLKRIREAVQIAEQNETDVKGDLLANIVLTSTRKANSLEEKKYHSPLLPKKVTDNMVEIPAGPFTMGNMDGDLNERPEHTVYVDEFLLDSSETTVKMYDEFLKQTKRQQKPGYRNWKDEITLDDREKPVIGVTWREANAYCRWRQKRLPTEAEWEKAARGNDERKYPWESSRQGDKKPANYDRQDPKENPYSVLTKIGSFKDAGGDSPYGIHDMAGNAWEWVADWYDGSAYIDIHSGGYPASSIGDVKILRGGAWDNNNNDDRLRSTFRLWKDPKDSYGTYGFRCARSIDTPVNDFSQRSLQR